MPIFLYVWDVLALQKWFILLNCLTYICVILSRSLFPLFVFKIFRSCTSCICLFICGFFLMQPFSSFSYSLTFLFSLYFLIFPSFQTLIEWLFWLFLLLFYIRLSHYVISLICELRLLYRLKNDLIIVVCSIVNY